MSGKGREAMQAMEQTCSLDVESASLRLQHTPFISLSLKEIKPASSVIWTQGRAKARRRPDWQPDFDFIVTMEEDDIHYVPVLPVLSTIGGIRPFQHPARGGVGN